MKMKIEEIHLDPENPRPRSEFTKEKLSELMRSMQTVGLLQPILVRPRREGGWTLVAGARRLHAAAELGWEQIDVLKHDDNRFDYRYARFIENEQREDIHPLEQAEEIQRLLPLHESVSQVADLLGRSPEYIRFLAEIHWLPDEVKKLWREGSLFNGHARLLLEVVDEQEKIAYAKNWSKTDWQGPRPLSRCKEDLLASVHLLKEAPFDIHDADLPNGACDECPHNTANDGVLFVELSDTARCAKESCWDEKVKANVNLALIRLEEKGETVLTPEAAQKECSFTGLQWNSKYVDLDETLSKYLSDPKKGRGKLGTVAKAQKVPTVHIVNPHTGQVIHAALRSQVDEALVAEKKVTKKEAQELDLDTGMSVAEFEKKKETATKRITANRRALTRFIEKIGDEEGTPDIEVMQYAIRNFPHSAVERVAKAHGIDVKKEYNADEKLMQLATDEKMGWKILTQLYVASHWVGQHNQGQLSPRVKEIARTFKFDLKKAATKEG